MSPGSALHQPLVSTEDWGEAGEVNFGSEISALQYVVAVDETLLAFCEN
jgi:hypothetical protein